MVSKSFKPFYLIFQKHFRGYLARKRVEQTLPDIVVIRSCLNEASSEAQADQTLRQKLLRVLRRLTNLKSVSHFSKEVEYLHYATSHSIEICQFMYHQHSVIRLFIDVFHSLNRSEPHKKIILNMMAVLFAVLVRNAPGTVRFDDHQASEDRDDSLYAKEELAEIAHKVMRNFHKSPSLVQAAQAVLDQLNKFA